LGDVPRRPDERSADIVAASTPIEDDVDRGDVAGIRRDIEHTRGELSETIDEIQARLEPRHLVQQAKEAARDASVSFVEEKKAALRDATLNRAEQFVGKAEQV